MKERMGKKTFNKRKEDDKFSFQDDTEDLDNLETYNTKSMWYNEFSDDPTDFTNVPDGVMIDLKFEAKKLYDIEVGSYNAKVARKRSDYKWMQTMMAKGTISDRIASSTVMIQDSPLHSLSVVRTLVNMVKVTKKKECIKVIDTLTELFVGELLVPDRKLRGFELCPLSLLDQLCSGNQATRVSRLVHWYFEDQLKQLYREFVEALNTASRDTLESNREKAVSAMYKLLISNPEMEALLLRNLVNKLGDPSQKIGTKVIYSMTRVLQEHPNMKTVVMQEIEKLLFRPNVSTKAQYYSICFLAQFIFSSEDATLARNMIKLYFSFFKACIKKGEVDSHMMRGLLMGVNRAYPFAKDEMSSISEHIETMYKVVHISNFNISIHALCLLFHVASYANSVSDRFYSALYKKLLDPAFGASTHHAMFLSLVFRALKKDNDIPRVKVFVKRLLQVCLYLPVHLACGVLMLVSHLLYQKRQLAPSKLESEYCGDEEEDDEDEHYQDVPFEEPVEPTRLTAGDASSVTTEKIKPSIATWHHCRNMAREDSKSAVRGLRYDPKHRNPMFAGGEHCVFVELVALSKHHHPTVALFARNITQGQTINYSGDPLLDFTLARFLERFVFKNPKKLGDHVGFQFDRKKNYEPTGAKALSVDSLQYLNLEATHIPEDELFLYNYLHSKRKQGLKLKEEMEDGSDVESVASEEFEELLDNLAQGKGDLDFAEDVGTSAANKKRIKATKETSDTDDDDEEGTDDDEDVGSDIDLDDGDDNLGLDDDAEDIVFDDDDDDGASDDLKMGETDFKKKLKLQKGKKYSSTNSDIFASAEEFSEMLQDIGASGLKAFSSETLSNKENAGVKQLKWEKKRDFWVNRADTLLGKRKRTGESKINKKSKKK